MEEGHPLVRLGWLSPHAYKKRYLDPRSTYAHVPFQKSVALAFISVDTKLADTAYKERESESERKREMAAIAPPSPAATQTQTRAVPPPKTTPPLLRSDTWVQQVRDVYNSWIFTQSEPLRRLSETTQSPPAEFATIAFFTLLAFFLRRDLGHFVNFLCAFIILRSSALSERRIGNAYCSALCLLLFFEVFLSGVLQFFGVVLLWDLAKLGVFFLISRGYLSGLRRSQERTARCFFAFLNTSPTIALRVTHAAKEFTAAEIRAAYKKLYEGGSTTSADADADDADDSASASDEDAQ